MKIVALSSHLDLGNEILKGHLSLLEVLYLLWKSRALTFILEILLISMNTFHVLSGYVVQ